MSQPFVALRWQGSVLIVTKLVYVFVRVHLPEIREPLGSDIDIMRDADAIQLDPLYFLNAD